jgi:hypothetical protein
VIKRIWNFLKEKVFDSAVAVKTFALTVLTAIGLYSLPSVASADAGADMTSLFTTATGLLATLETNYVALVIMFISLGVVSLGYYYVTKGMKQGKRAG